MTNPSLKRRGGKESREKKTRFRREPIASDRGDDEKRGKVGQFNPLYRQRWNRVPPRAVMVVRTCVHAHRWAVEGGGGTRVPYVM